MMVYFESLYKFNSYNGYVLKCLIFLDCCLFVMMLSDKMVKLWNLDGFKFECVFEGY